MNDKRRNMALVMHEIEPGLWVLEYINTDTGEKKLTTEPRKMTEKQAWDLHRKVTNYIEAGDFPSVH